LRVTFAFGVAIVAALYAVGVMRGATANSSPAVTAKTMVTALEAIHYPVAHPRKLNCRGLGAVQGRHRTFRCVATLSRHRDRRFYTRAVAKGGWLCAGKARSHCAMLGRGFFPASEADNQGWQEIAAAGWLQAHHFDVNRASLTCTGTRSPMTCTLTTRPSVTVVLTYQKAGTGYVETARRG
jgi:hypothetical protein